MPEKRERIEVEVPQGQLIVSHARCPAGCDLMDAAVPIHDHPSIHVSFRHEGQEGQIHLDPVFGSHDNVLEPEVALGTVIHFMCPHCGTSLEEEGSSCPACSAPMFMVQLPGGSFVEACQRNGCVHHKLRIVSGEQLMQRLFDDIGMDSFL